MSFGQVGDLPGTLAGGQDDVSSHKLPQTSPVLSECMWPQLTGLTEESLSHVVLSTESMTQVYLKCANLSQNGYGQQIRKNDAKMMPS